MNSLVLIGSDDTALRRLKTQLVKAGFQVNALEVSSLARLEGLKERCLLAILDGTQQGRLVELVAQVRSKAPFKEAPLLVLMKESHIRELSMLNGIEDFLVFPVEPIVLQSRIRFILKRLNHALPGEGGIRISKLHLDVDKYEVTLNEEPLELTYKEFELLKFLATHPGRVYSRDQLLNQVWGYDFIGGTRTVDVHIRRLRAKLGPKYASLIDTVRNVGYKFLESLR